jgi:diadenosine tetraphosphatase ApaH/serine/threonine PP2A family protein phosphatase
MTTSLPGIERLKVQGRRPSLPADLRLYAVGDIHGRLDLLNELLRRVDADLALRPAPRPIFVFLGDYIDRGPCSRETIDRLIEHRERNECVFLKGNHEQIAIKCLSDPSLFHRWMRLGGAETLVSYGITPPSILDRKKIAELQTAFHHALSRSHFRFFRDQQTSFECGDFFFAHAGVKPRIELSRQAENDLLWIRDEFLYSSEDFGKTVVHGHTPTLEIEIRPNRINIDTGAFATNRLTCLVIEESKLSYIDTLHP